MTIHGVGGRGIGPGLARHGNSWGHHNPISQGSVLSGCSVYQNKSRKSVLRRVCQIQLSFPGGMSQESKVVQKRNEQNLLL